MNTTALIASIDAEIARLTSARDLLANNAAVAPEKKKPGRPKGSKHSSAKTATKTAGKRTLSAAGRASIAAAQKARWAAKKKGSRSKTL